MKKQNLSRKKFSKRVSKNLRKLSKKVGRKVGGRRIKQKKSQKRTKGRKMKKRTRKNRQRGGSGRDRRDNYRNDRKYIDEINLRITGRMNDFFKEIGVDIRFKGGFDSSHTDVKYYVKTEAALDIVEKHLTDFMSKLENGEYDTTQRILLIDGANILRDWCNKGLPGEPRDDCTGLSTIEKAELLEDYQLSYYDQIIATYKKDNQQRMLTRGTYYTGNKLELSFVEEGGNWVSHGADDLCILAIAAMLQYDLGTVPVNRTLGRKLSNHEQSVGHNAAGNRRPQYQLEPGIYLATGDKMNHVQIYIKGSLVRWNQNSGGTHMSDRYGAGGYGGGYAGQEYAGQGYAGQGYRSSYEGRY